MTGYYYFLLIISDRGRDNDFCFFYTLAFLDLELYTHLISLSIISSVFIEWGVFGQGHLCYQISAWGL